MLMEQTLGCYPVMMLAHLKWSHSFDPSHQMNKVAYEHHLRLLQQLKQQQTCQVLAQISVKKYAISCLTIIGESTRYFDFHNDTNSKVQMQCAKQHFLCRQSMIISQYLSHF